MDAYYNFPWNNSIVVEQVYKGKDNYKIVETGTKNSKMLIVFSGNSLYTPNTEESFFRIIVKNDRYEWQNVVKDKRIKKYYSKIVLVRDIYKQWYVNGISSRINSIGKLIEFIKKISHGYMVTVCGCSAGGYIATIVGASIKADKIFNFSGQYTVEDQIEKEADNAPLLFSQAQNPAKRRYYTITTVLPKEKDDIWGKIYHFYPIGHPWDVMQVALVRDTKVHFLRLKVIIME